MIIKRDWAASSNFINYSTLNSEHNWEDLRIVQEMYKHALPMTIVKRGEIQFSFRFLLLLHCRFANTTQILFCKSDR